MKLTRPASSLIRPAIYWVATGLVVLETAVGAEWDLARIRFVRDIFDHLGYPYYLLTILGIWKVPAVIALAAPGFQRVKEWAYTGIFLVYSGAVASHLMAGDAREAWSPLFLAILTVVSWAMRPESRKLPGRSLVPASPLASSASSTPALTRRVVYWVFTALLALALISGGVAQLLGAHENVEGIMHLGYPAFFVTILGFWKLVGGITILLPRLRLAKEWAYAGIVFNMSGAAVSNAVSGMPAWHVVVNLVLLAMAVLSWAWRPANRKMPVS